MTDKIKYREKECVTRETTTSRAWDSHIQSEEYAHSQMNYIEEVLERLYMKREELQEELELSEKILLELNLKQIEEDIEKEEEELFAEEKYEDEEDEMQLLIELEKQYTDEKLELMEQLWNVVMSKFDEFNMHGYVETQLTNIAQTDDQMESLVHYMTHIAIANSFGTLFYNKSSSQLSFPELASMVDMIYSMEKKEFFAQIMKMFMTLGKNWKLASSSSAMLGNVIKFPVRIETRNQTIEGTLAYSENGTLEDIIKETESLNNMTINTVKLGIQKIKPRQYKTTIKKLTTKGLGKKVLHFSYK
jgi:hypothetical protein